MSIDQSPRTDPALAQLVQAAQPGEPLALPDVPAVPGLVFRRMRGEADYAGMAAVLNAANATDGLAFHINLEQFANTYAHLTNCDPLHDVIIAEVAGAIVAYGRGWWEEHTTGETHYRNMGYVAPEWRRRGIGTAILHFVQDRLRSYALSHAAQHHTRHPAYYYAYGTQTAVGEVALLVNDGYHEYRLAYQMARPLTGAAAAPLPEAPLPAGLEVRPVRPEHYRLVWEADRDAFQDHFGYVTPTEAEYAAWLAEPVLFQPKLWKVAWDVERDEIAGMVRGYVNEVENEHAGRKRGYAEFISTRKPWRRRGLARALIVHTLQMFKHMGLEEAALGVDAENRDNALALYQGLGFKVEQVDILFRKPIDLT